jgi:hypothetical protein
MGASGEGSLAGQVNIGVLWGSQVYVNRGIGVYKQTSPAKVRARSDLRVG